MNDILEFLNSHASVRKFTDKPISEEDEKLILTTAQRSPTSSNVQAYSVISVRDPKTKHLLAELCGGQAHVSLSALFLIFCADMFRLKQLAEVRGYQFHGDSTESFVVAAVDTALAAGRALQAAQALGLGGVMVGGIRNEPDRVAELLHLPELVFPLMGMSLGWPEAPTKIKPRLPLTALAFSEFYDPSAMAEPVAKYDAAVAAVGYLEGREVDKARYPEFSGVYSWSEHTARRMASDNPRTNRLHLKEFLTRKGFLRR